MKPRTTIPWPSNWTHSTNPADNNANWLLVVWGHEIAVRPGNPAAMIITHTAGPLGNMLRNLELDE